MHKELKLRKNDSVGEQSPTKHLAPFRNTYILEVKTHVKPRSRYLILRKRPLKHFSPTNNLQVGFFHLQGKMDAYTSFFAPWLSICVLHEN